MSATADQVQQIVTTDEAIEDLWTRVMAGEFASIHDAARARWRFLRFKPTDVDFLALEGLMSIARRAQGESRRGPHIAVGAPHGRQWKRYLALSWPYEDASGQSKPLGEFTIDDLAALTAWAGKLVLSYERRQKWASDTLDLLKEHDVQRVLDLPDDVLAAVNEAAREAMGRQQ